jgi:hypothetical protein
LAAAGAGAAAESDAAVVGFVFLSVVPADSVVAGVAVASVDATASAVGLSVGVSAMFAVVLSGLVLDVAL